MFKEFKDVKARDEVKQEESALEKLITLVDKLVNDSKLQETIKDYPTIQVRNYIEEKIMPLEINYNEKDIVSLIRSSNLEDCDSKIVFGMYAGCLLTKLTEARNAKGEKTSMVIDGVNQDYILAGTKKADNVIINNCKGYCISFGIGDYGNVTQVIINNCEGGDIGQNIGGNGNVNQVIINNSKGFIIGEYIGSTGNVGQVIINNCEGDSIGFEIGCFDGNVKQVIINKCEGDYIGEGIGCQVNVKQAIINNPDEIEKQGLTELIELVDSLTGKNYQEIQDIAKRIGEYSNV